MTQRLETKTGRIVKAIAGFYYCMADGVLYECRGRGAFRKNEITPLAGDLVEFFPGEEQKGGTVTAILPRKNELVRPPVANLDQLFLVISICDPVPNMQVIDKLITVCEYKHIEPVLIVTKIDLADAASFCRIYEQAGFQVLSLSNEEPQHLDTIRQMMAGKISAFAGNTGVGKSSLLNNLFPSLCVDTGEISQKLGRGRHTTRHVTLYDAGGGGFIADTPGFGTMEIGQYEIIRKEELAGCFREFLPYEGACRFVGCSHTAEKGCAVREAVADGIIDKHRYESYCAFYEQAKQLKDWEIKKMKKPVRR